MRKHMESSNIRRCAGVESNSHQHADGPLRPCWGSRPSSAGTERDRIELQLRDLAPGTEFTVPELCPNPTRRGLWRSAVRMMMSEARLEVASDPVWAGPGNRRSPTRYRRTEVPG